MSGVAGYPPAHKKPFAVLLKSGGRVVRAKPPPERNCPRWSAAESCPDCRSVVTTSLSSRWPGRAGGGGEHLGASVARVRWRDGRAAKRGEGAAAEDGSEAGTRTAVGAAF